MIGALAILLAFAGTPTLPQSSDWFDLVQGGRAVNVTKVAEAARRCGFRTAEASIAHGVALYHNPDDQGGELELRTVEATSRTRMCLRRKIRALAKRYPDLELVPDAL